MESSGRRGQQLGAAAGKGQRYLSAARSCVPAPSSRHPALPSSGLRRRGNAHRPAGERSAGGEEEQSRRSSRERSRPPPHAALPPPNWFKKIHQLHHRAPLKDARRHLVGVNSGRRRERAGWVRVTLRKAAGGRPCARRPNKEAWPPPVSRSGRRWRPLGRGPGGPRVWPGGRGKVREGWSGEGVPPS